MVVMEMPRKRNETQTTVSKVGKCSRGEKEAHTDIEALERENRKQHMKIGTRETEEPWRS